MQNLFRTRLAPRLAGEVRCNEKKPPFLLATREQRMSKRRGNVRETSILLLGFHLSQG